jgi:hypothetical protein
MQFLQNGEALHRAGLRSAVFCICQQFMQRFCLQYERFLMLEISGFRVRSCAEMRSRSDAPLPTSHTGSGFLCVNDSELLAHDFGLDAVLAADVRVCVIGEIPRPTPMLLPRWPVFATHAYRTASRTRSCASFLQPKTLLRNRSGRRIAAKVATNERPSEYSRIVFRLHIESNVALKSFSVDA